MTYDPADDALKSDALGKACLREMRVRSGRYQPVNEAEKQWAREGERPNAELETLRRGTA